MTATGAATPVQANPPRRPGVVIREDARAKIRILVVDDEHTLRESCGNLLREEGYNITTCGKGEDALELVAHQRFDIVLVDLYMSHVDGLTILRATLEAKPDTIVIVMTGNPSVDSSIEAIREGAWDYVPKPFAATHLQVLIGRAAHTVMVGQETQQQRADNKRAGTNEQIALLGSAASFQKVIELAQRVAPTDASVFITGESGSGKEMIARFIHQNSRRASRPFVALNCAALPETLLESEMFGHRKGAFTGAVRDKPGLLETANGGTMFLDELVEMPKTIQAKLLRVIQDGVVRRVGSETTDMVVNVRFIAATNGDPETAIQSGTMREDLYYRLRVVPVRVPPLRERVEDIPLLARHFLTTYWSRHRPRVAPPVLSEPAIRALCAHAWPGNVRELQNVIEHAAVLLDPGAEIGATQLPISEGRGPSVGPAAVSLISPLMEEGYHTARDRVVAEFEIQYLTWLVNRAGGNMSKAARIAGVDRTTLYRLMERHGLHRTRNTAWVVERSSEDMGAASDNGANAVPAEADRQGP